MTELEKAKDLFAELYQVLGVHDASELAMDIANDAANGVFRTDELLPYGEDPKDKRIAELESEIDAVIKANTILCKEASDQKLRADNAEKRIAELESENESIKNRVKEIAVNQQPDYPDVETQTVYSQLWAIEQGWLGLIKANEEVHLELEKAKQLIAELERLRVEEAALVMANARRIIKRSTMSNARLFMELHGSGMGTAFRYCREMLGLNPNDNKTSYNEMMSSIDTEQLRKEQE